MPGNKSTAGNPAKQKKVIIKLLESEAGRDCQDAQFKRYMQTFVCDCRKTYTKSDWALWCAAMAGSREEFDALVAGVYRFADETPSRVPLSDWYETVGEGKMVGFLARSVVGGFLMPMLTAAAEDDVRRTRQPHDEGRCSR